MQKVILDTDIGSDIDDALCLAYLLAHPKCDLLGITTVSGQPLLRAEMASAMCKHVGADIPIYPGVEVPILGKIVQSEAQQAAALGDWPRERKFPQGEAVSFLRDTIRANPGEINLLAIGPLTNIGLLFATDPEIPGLLKSLWLMCGQFRADCERIVEWNARCDYIAAAVTYQARPKVFRSVGLDVTMQCKMDADQARKRFKEAKAIGPASDFAEIWFKNVPDVVFHDPLTAACLFNDDICKFTRGNVEVDIKDKAGLTHFESSDDGAHEVALEVSPEAFFEDYFNIVT
jgi:inosine-uridine nucleoside N-ribohydrolase